MYKSSPSIEYLLGNFEMQTSARIRDSDNIPYEIILTKYVREQICR